jgi:tRNA(adenine34) deaminase
MAYALEVAHEAAEKGEVPVGAALLLPNGDILKGANTCHSSDQPLLHAEFKVLQQACERFKREQLRQSMLFVTLEPCPMCMGAILHSHLGTLVFGSYNLKWGAAGTVIDFRTYFPADALKVYGGICETESAQLLASFFKERR